MAGSALALAGLLMSTLGLAPSSASASAAVVDNQACRPDGMYTTPGVDVPYCNVYDSAGREKMGADHQRRVIGYSPGGGPGRTGRPPTW